jgi:hypothetical protein
MVVVTTPSIPQCRVQDALPLPGKKTQKANRYFPQGNNSLFPSGEREGKNYPNSPTNSGEDPKKKVAAAGAEARPLRLVPG